MSQNAKNNDARSFSMMQECVDSFQSEDRSDGKRHVHIEIPERFADLWLVKLSELRATMAEIREYEPEEAPPEPSGDGRRA